MPILKGWCIVRLYIWQHARVIGVMLRILLVRVILLMLIMLLLWMIALMLEVVHYWHAVSSRRAAMLRLVLALSEHVVKPLGWGLRR